MRAWSCRSQAVLRARRCVRRQPRSRARVLQARAPRRLSIKSKPCVRSLASGLENPFAILSGPNVARYLAHEVGRTAPQVKGFSTVNGSLVRCRGFAITLAAVFLVISSTLGCFGAVRADFVSRSFPLRLGAGQQPASLGRPQPLGDGYVYVQSGAQMFRLDQRRGVFTAVLNLPQSCARGAVAALSKSKEVFSACATSGGLALVRRSGTVTVTLLHPGDRAAAMTGLYPQFVAVRGGFWFAERLTSRVGFCTPERCEPACSLPRAQDPYPILAAGDKDGVVAALGSQVWSLSRGCKLVRWRFAPSEPVRHIARGPSDQCWFATGATLVLATPDHAVHTIPTTADIVGIGSNANHGPTYIVAQDRATRGYTLATFVGATRQGITKVNLPQINGFALDLNDRVWMTVSFLHVLVEYMRENNR